MIIYTTMHRDYQVCFEKKILVEYGNDSTVGIADYR